MNFCDVLSWAIDSRHFNLVPRLLNTQGVRRVRSFLFPRLDGDPAPNRRAQSFHDDMDVAFLRHP